MDAEKKSLTEDKSESLLCNLFLEYRNQLDQRNDKYERLVKCGRDITIQSKRVIFGLLRKNLSKEKKINDAEGQVCKIMTLFEKIDKELKGEDQYRFTKAYKNGVQEFTEAISLLYFMKTGNLISYSDFLELYIKDLEDILITHFDYMLGIADLTGELMRMSINAVANGEKDELLKGCEMLKLIYHEFVRFTSFGWEFSRKIEVMKNSMDKVENACYLMSVRGSEKVDKMLISIMDDKPED